MRRRLMVAIAGVAALAVTLFALPLAVVLQRNYRNAELLRLQRDTVSATRTVDLGAQRRDAVELPAGGGRFAVYDASGRLVAGAGPVRADAIVRSAVRSASPSDQARDGRLVAAVPLLAGERVTGALRAERSDAAAARATHRAWLALAGLGAIVVALAVLAAALLGRRLARPLERLAVAAGRLGEGNFAARAPRGGVPEADQIAAALDRTAARLDDLLARERAFSVDASHQLRTPLAALRLELEAIALNDPAPPELPGALAQVDRLQTTIDTLLAVARDVPRADSRTDLIELVHELEQRWRGPLAADARPLHVLDDGEPAVVRAAAGVVSEILEVLLDNAHRHGRGAIAVEVRGSEEWVALDVSDQGIGFSGDADVFARRSTAHRGHGIGLPLAHSLADAEGGRLTITRSCPPTVTLWLARASDDEPAAARRARRSRTTSDHPAAPAATSSGNAGSA